MGSVGFTARLLGSVAASRALHPAAASVLGAGPRFGLLPVGRRPIRPALCRGCRLPERARGLHCGPRLQEHTVPEALAEAGPAGTRGESSAGGGRCGHRGAESRPAEHTGPKFDIDMLVSLLRQENAKDICVIKVPPEMKYTDYFVIGSGTSTRHLQAMAYYLVKMYKHLKCKSEPHVKIEGKETDDWLCVDFGSMVIHLMLPETRETYELEKLWTLRSYDDQLAEILPESLPKDFILGLEDTSSPAPVEFKYE